jgi:type IV secretory pathway TrbL component
MKKFLVLYESTVPASEQMKSATPEQAKAGMDAWMSWAGRAAGGIVDMGSPVATAGKLTGPTQIATGNSQVGGYSILQAESKDALMDVLKDHPHFRSPGASIEVFEFLPMPGV